MWHLKCDTNALIYAIGRLTDTENRAIAAKRVESEKGWTGNLVLADANYYI